MAVRDRTRVATMFGYGPRYLHSTGQLHKGGPNTGVFVLITATPRAGRRRFPGSRSRSARSNSRRRSAISLARRDRPARAARASAGAGSALSPRLRSCCCAASAWRGVRARRQLKIGRLRSTALEARMQLGFVGLGKMGLNMVTRLIARRPPRRRVRPERRGGRARRRRRRQRRRLA